MIFAADYARIPLAKGIKGHSIIAIEGDGDPIEGSDGVVEYQSAHVDYAESEFIVQPSSHSCQDHPLAIKDSSIIERLMNSIRQPTMIDIMFTS